jgi:two-component system, cell cycle sensor histidine kinase and response regulator CckA
MLPSRQTVIFALPFAAALVTLLFGLLLLDLERSGTAAQRQADRYHAASESLSRIHFSLKDVESSQRGYVLTGDAELLASHDTARRQVAHEFATLAALSATPGEDAIVQQLRGYAQARMDAIEEVIEARRGSGLDAAAAIMATGRGRESMQRFETAIGRVGALMEAQRAARERERAGRTLLLRWIIVLGTLTAGGTALGSSLVVAGYARSRDHVARELAAREERFEALVENAADAILVLSGGGGVDYASASAERILGYGPGELTGRPLLDLIDPDDAPAFRSLLDSLRADTHATAPIEARFHSREHGVRTLSGRAQNLISHPAVGGIVINCEDVTDRRRTEEQLRQAQKLEAIGRLAGGVAHDFNNILSVVIGNIYMALADLPADSPVREDLEEVDAAADRAVSLTRQLLAFSRQQVLQPEVVDLNGIVEGVARLLERTLGTDVEIVKLLEPALGAVRADPGQVEQILMNLAVNARDAMPAGGTVIMETRNVEFGEDVPGQYDEEVRPGPYVMLALSDTGSGIAPAVRERIFDPFFTTKPQGEGTGLGLSTVYGIVKQSGGYLWVYTEEGHGTTFKVFLPRVDEVPAEREAEADAAPLPLGAGVVLLVEDEASVRRIARRALVRSGYQVLEAADGEEALSVAAAADEIDLLLTDLVMPRLGGRELATRLRALRPGLRVLFTSGYTEEAAVRQGTLETGISFLQKPYAPDVLIRKVMETLEP